MQLAGLHEGVLLLQSLSILAHQLKQNCCLAVVDGHVQGFEGFENK